MYEIENDMFYEFAEEYGSVGTDRFIGEVGYFLIGDDKPYEGLRSHKEALITVFDRLVEESIDNRESAGMEYGDEIADKLTPLVYDIEKAQAKQLDAGRFFYCPNIVKVDYYGNTFYDAEWRPNDENIGTTVPYWYAVLEPVHGRNKPADFKKVNEVLFPNGTERLEIYEWTTDWSDLFDAGHEWYGACCWSIYDKSMSRYVVMLVSATD